MKPVLVQRLVFAGERVMHCVVYCDYIHFRVPSHPGTPGK